MALGEVTLSPALPCLARPSPGPGNVYQLAGLEATVCSAARDMVQSSRVLSQLSMQLKDTCLRDSEFAAGTLGFSPDPQPWSWVWSSATGPVLSPRPEEAHVHAGRGERNRDWQSPGEGKAGRGLLRNQDKS